MKVVMLIVLLMVMFVGCSGQFGVGVEWILLVVVSVFVLLIMVMVVFVVCFIECVIGNDQFSGGLFCFDGYGDMCVGMNEVVFWCVW